MKIRVIFIGINLFLLVISLLQVFPVPPYSETLYPRFESGYFAELRNQQEIIRDAFLNIKIEGKPESAWIFLHNLKEKYKIDASVYNSYGHLVRSPGERIKEQREEVLEKINRGGKEISSEIKFHRFASLLPLSASKRCRFCHKSVREGDTIGFLHVEQPFDAHIYYTGERIFIFSVIILMLCVTLFFLFRWEPEGKIKEMFDKS